MDYLSQRSESVSSPAKAEFGAYRRSDDAILHDTAISRVHAMVFYGEQGAGILDVGSTNGTFVNDERINARSLANGDSILLGNMTLDVVFE